MILFVYKDGMCDPGRNVGICRKFGLAKDLDDYVNFFCASVDPRYLSKYRAFIANDTVDFQEMDHYQLFGEHLGVKLKGQSIKEVNLYEIAKQVNEILKKREKIKAKQIAEAEKRVTREVVDQAIKDVRLNPPLVKE